MLNYVQFTDDLKNLSDDQIRNIAVNPANPIYGTLAVGELDRRNRVRQDFMSRAANPMTTIAQQVVMGAPPTPPQQGAAPAGPAAPSPTGQAPMGMPASGGGGPTGLPMAGGGGVTEALQRLRSLEDLMRVPQYETLQGSMGAADELMGADPYAGLRAMVERYRAGSGRRNNMDLTQLLLRMGTGMMNSRRPDYLGALGEGMTGAVSGLDDLVERRNQEERQGISDEGTLAQAAAGERNRRLETATDLYGVGRSGIEHAADSERSILGTLGNLATANIYANARMATARGRYAGMSLTDLARLRAGYNSARSAAASRMRALAQEGYGEGDSEYDDARQAYEQADAEFNAVQQAMREATGVSVPEAPSAPPGPGSVMGSVVGGLSGGASPDTAAQAAPATNNPAVRPQAQAAPGYSVQVRPNPQGQSGGDYQIRRVPY